MLSNPRTCSAQKLYVAEYDLAFFKHREYMVRHLRKTKLQHPPGDEIYRNGNVSMVRTPRWRSGCCDPDCISRHVHNC